MRNRWWKDVLGALLIVATVGTVIALTGCSGVRPYVEVGADAEIRKQQAHRCTTLGFASIGASKGWKGGAIEGDLALRHYSCLFKEDDEAEDNAIGAHVRIYPRELRKK